MFLKKPFYGRGKGFLCRNIFQTIYKLQIMDRKVLTRVLTTVIAAAALISAGGCRKEEGNSFITLSLNSDYSHYELKRLSESIRASSGNTLSLPDTNNFILSVYHENGSKIYEGPYGSRPNPIRVTAGSYNIGLQSVKFPKPAFSTPQFGDKRTIMIADNENVAVTFGCSQLNCGVKIEYDQSFIDRFPNYVPKITATDGGYLVYSYAEKRFAFFNPGILKLHVEKNGSITPILNRQLSAADMLTLKLSAVPDNDTDRGFSIIIDTTRNWLSEDYVVGSGNDGSTMQRALTVKDMSMYIGAKGVWVKGYIVGGDLSASKVNTTPPFSKASHIAIADRNTVSGRADCAGVEIPSKEEIRKALNLVDNPNLIGRTIYVKGNIEEYFSHPGIKSITQYSIE